MRLKVDENVPLRVTRLLADHGHDVTTVRDQGLQGCDDATLAHRAAQEDRMLVTLDRGFADIRRYPPGTHAGMLVVRVPDQRPALVGAVVHALLSEHDLDALRRCIVIAEPRRVRIRRPEP